jgi:hypothetical protein
VAVKDKAASVTDVTSAAANSCHHEQMLGFVLAPAGSAPIGSEMVVRAAAVTVLRDATTRQSRSWLGSTFGNLGSL